MIELPATLIQADAISAAAQQRGMSVTDWAMDCLLTYASNHLSRGLGQWLAAEQAYVAAGDYPACGATLVVSEGRPEQHTFVCVRIRNHQVEAVASRESHAGLMPDGQSLTTWQE